ncbi:hypothetical protein ACNJX9_04355 [Bradyrhizobium sp. DASA03076]|uniref:hypothetical protein n=1 Tax=Bradyrhizobium sp. BLXBL-03 TaxID=3395916 RepID=UPI003F71627D
MQKMPPLKRMPISLPHDLHAAFKAKCAREGVLMSATIRKLLERECSVRGAPVAKPSRPAREVRA